MELLKTALIGASVLLLLGHTNAQEVAQECPEENGFYADAVQCDRYYECKDGQITDKLCPDGLVFDENSIQFAKCSFQFSVDCTSRPELQPAKGSGLCPRLNGYFPHEDPTVCDKFYFCVDGVANPITCPASLIFDPSRGQCAYSDQVKRKGCSGEEVFKFECPTGGESSHEHPRFPDPNDCQFFYICINGVSPRRNGCTDGLVFNKKSLACEKPANVEDECKTWYNATYLESLKERRPQNSRPISTLKQRKRVKVIRKNQNPVTPLRAEEPQPDAAPIPVPDGRPLRSRTRVRQRRPVPRPSQPAPSEPESGPPSFALNDPDSIQQFRRNHGFNNGGVAAGDGGNSRLTILQTPTNPLSPVEPAENEPVPVPSRRQRPAHRRRPSNQRRSPLSRSPPSNEDGASEGPEFNSFRARF